MSEIKIEGTCLSSSTDFKAVGDGTTLLPVELLVDVEDFSLDNGVEAEGSAANTFGLNRALCTLA